jgi:3-phenylpropionate/trans-cinnamate dioxygenase ferredoxin reductase subunit
LSAGVLIVGANQAGVQLAVTLRELGYEDPVTLVGAESRPPYQRPPLSKAFLLGKAGEASLAFRTAAFYADHGIDLICGERVVGVSLPTGDSVGAATTDTGRTLGFDRLALAVGARPRRLGIPGAELEGVRYLRGVDDSVRLRTDLGPAARVVVVGGGNIGLEVAAVARTLGKEVTVVEAAERLIARSVAPVVSAFYREAHERRGVSVRLAAAVVALTGRSGRVTGVELSDGTVLPADLVLVGVGAVPRTELAEAMGLHCKGGIIVDRFARTSNPAVVAAGDCTVLPHQLTGEGRIRLESVQNAVSQAKVAAATVAGRPAAYSEVPWFWSDQYELKLQIAGLAAGYDEYVLRGDPAEERFSVLYYRGDRLVAVDAVNSAADYLTVRKALATGAAIRPGLARDAARPLKTLLVQADVAA